MVPLYKGKGDRTDLKNFCPISLLSAISMVCEGVIMEQLMKHMTDNCLWSRDQHAYHQGLSTATALLTLQEEWLEMMDRKLQNLLSLDMFSAFDTDCNEILLRKLKIYGVGEDALQLIKSCLSHRSQAVEIGNHRSEYLWVKHGVPQGSCLGSLLFIIHQ